MEHGLVIHLRTKSGKPLGTRVLDWQEVLGEMAAQLGTVATRPEERPKPAVIPQTAPVHQDFFSIGDLATRWRCSRGSVYNRLRRVGASVLDFAPRGKRSRKAVSLKAVLDIEVRQSKRLQ